MQLNTSEQFTIENSPDADEVWAGIGGHFDNYCQILCEFIDNSLSDFRANPNHIPNEIVIEIKRDENGAHTKIEDSGTGIKNLDASFTLGSTKAKESPLNEHGFGMKHALASADPLNRTWKIATRTQENYEDGTYTVIQAPYRFKLPATIEHSNWPGHYNCTGTIVEFTTSETMFETISKGIRGTGSRMEYFINILAEDLGFTYATPIIKGELRITIVYFDDSATQQKKQVEAVQPKWDYVQTAKDNPKKLLEGFTRQDLGKGEIDIKYKFGMITESEGNKRYYKCNQSSSGVEIRINGRAIEYNIFEEIWCRAKHNIYNSLLIQLDLQSRDSRRLPETRTSKNGLRKRRR